MTYARCLCGPIAALMLVVTSATAQSGPKAAAVHGEASASNHIMLGNLGEDVDDYLGSADLWGSKADYWVIWIGWSNGNITVRNDFADNGDEFQGWMADGGAFVGTTFTSDMHEVYELLPGVVATRNQHSAIETAHVVDTAHPIVNEPNDIIDDDDYTAWAWTAGDVYTEWEEYTVIATQTDDVDSPPMWLVHESLPVVVTTMQPTWSRISGRT